MRKLLVGLMLALSIYCKPAYADFKSYAGSFLANTSTGNQSITGVGFQPKVVIFLTQAKVDAQGFNNVAQGSIGVGISSSSRFSITHHGSGNAANPFAWGGSSSSKCLLFIQGFPSVLLAADFVSQDANGFTINWTTVTGTSTRIFYIALGGSDLKVVSSNFALSGSTGNQSITGTGWKPDLVMFVNDASSDVDNASGKSSSNFNVGFATSSSNQFAIGRYNKQGTTPTSAGSIQVGDKCITRLSNATTLDVAASFVSMDNNGFTINVTNAGSRRIHYLAIKGIQASIQSFVESVSTGAQTVSLAPFKPTTGLFFSTNKVSSASITANAPLMMSSVDELKNYRVAMSDSQDAVSANSKEQGWTDETKFLKHGTAKISTQTMTIDAEATFTDWVAGGFNYNQTLASATQREVYAVLMAPVSGVHLYNKKLYNQKKY